MNKPLRPPFDQWTEDNPPTIDEMRRAVERWRNDRILDICRSELQNYVDEGAEHLANGTFPWEKKEKVVETEPIDWGFIGILCFWPGLLLMMAFFLWLMG